MPALVSDIDGRVRHKRSEHHLVSATATAVHANVAVAATAMAIVIMGWLRVMGLGFFVVQEVANGVRCLQRVI